MRGKMERLKESLHFVILYVAIIVGGVTVGKFFADYKIGDMVVSYLKLWISEDPIEKFIVGFLIAIVIGYAAGLHDAS